jgi:phosphomannomutase/phosphoglucomutase
LQKDGGVMVTASHNPKEYNGFKICYGLDSVHGVELLVIHDLIEQSDFEIGSGKIEKREIIPAYLDFVTENVKINRPFRVGVDAGNGTAGIVAAPLLKKFGCELVELYCEPDGTFPNHEADPTVAENMADLIEQVKEKKLDVGIGFDGDGDRIGIIDENGNIVYGDKLLTIFAREILSRKPKATFISEVKCSQVMYDEIEKHGGRAIMWKTGHSRIKQKMKEENAELAGEMSGHIFFADRFFGYDDAIYAACRLLEIMSETGNTVSGLIADLPETYNTPEIRVESPDDVKFEVVEEVAEQFQGKYKVIDIDGVRVIFEDGSWGLVRASNTQPALVLRFEAPTQKRLDEVRNLIESVLIDVQKQREQSET